MARFEYSAGEDMEETLDRLDREGRKRIVMAGAEALAKQMQGIIGETRHVRTGSMRQNVRPGQYHEDPEKAWVEVYPQGEDSRGVSNAKKAFVINYGYGRRRTAKTGDKFITGNKKKFETEVAAAMQAENDRVVSEVNK